MRVATFYIVFFIVCTVQLNAQQWLWTSRTGSADPQDEGFDQVYAVETNGQGDVFALYRCGLNNSPPYAVFNDNDTTWVAMYGDAFVSKYDSTGHRLWSRPILQLDTLHTSLGLLVEPEDMAIDSNGNIYITGLFIGNVVCGSDTFASASPYQTDMFVIKFDSAMTPLWARSSQRLANLGGLPSESRRICTDNEGNVIIGGYIRDSVLFGGDTLVDLFPGNIYSGFVMKFDASGNTVWSKIVQSSHQSVIDAVCSDDSGNVYVAGPLFGTISHQGDTVSGIGLTSYVLKLEADGDHRWFAESLTINDMEFQDSLLYCGGELRDTIIVDSVLYSPPGYSEAAVTCLDVAGNHRSVMLIHGSVTERFTRIAITPTSVLAAGNFLGSISWDSSSVSTGPMEYDLFYAEFGLDDSLHWITVASSIASDQLAGITADAQGHIYVVGSLYDPTCHLGNLTMDVEYMEDCFIGRIQSHPFCGFLPMIGNADTTICSSDPVQLTAQPGFSSYGWSNNQNSQSITVNSAGTFTYYAIDSAGCFYQGPAQTVNVESPLAIVLYASEDTLYCSQTFSIEWLLNGTHLTNNNTGWLIPNTPGWYCAVDSDLDHCNDTSNCIYWNPTGTFEAPASSVAIYPNPASETITVDAGSMTGVRSCLLIRNAIGEVVLTQELTSSRTIIPVTQLPAGLYYYQIDAGGELTGSGLFVKVE